MFDAAIAAIETFRSKSYPELALSREELATLSWCMENPVTTPSGEPSTDVHFEVKRTLNRLSNMELLRSGNYERFTSIQSEPKMTKEQFDFFAAKIQALSPSQYQALRAVTIISAIPFAPEAKRRAQEHLRPLPADSVEFLDITLARCPDIYPAISILDEAGKLLARESFAFGHLRHMLYIEGNQGMYKALEDSSARMADPRARAEAFNFCYMQWLINITGFKVITEPGKDPHGSMYLHQGNASALIKLHELTEHGMREPAFIPNILPAYLAFRAEGLDLSSEEENLRYLATQIAAWSRLYTKTAALPLIIESLREALSKMPGTVVLPQPDKLCTRTPTFAPAVFDNTSALLPSEPKLALQIALSIYIAAYKEYSERIAGKDSFTCPPLSLRLAADKKAIQAIISDLKAHPEKQGEFPCCSVSLNEAFEVIIAPAPGTMPFAGAHAAASGGASGGSMPPAPAS